MRVMGMALVIGTHETISKGFDRVLEDLEIRGQTGVIQTTTLLRSTRILRRLLKS